MCAVILCDATADETAWIGARLSEYVESDAAAVKDALRECLELVDCIDIAPGDIRITLSGEHLANQVDVVAARINEDLLTIT